MKGHYEWLYRWTQEASKQKSTAALVLSYSLAPEAKYPTQLQQSITLLNYMLTTGGRRPSQVGLYGHSRWQAVLTSPSCSLVGILPVEI